jgi:hypothetical protein
MVDIISSAIRAMDLTRLYLSVNGDGRGSRRTEVLVLTTEELLARLCTSGDVLHITLRNAEKADIELFYGVRTTPNNTALILVPKICQHVLHNWIDCLPEQNLHLPVSFIGLGLHNLQHNAGKAFRVRAGAARRRP